MTLRGYDAWKTTPPSWYYGDAPEPCACCGEHDSMPDEHDADEDGRHVIRHDLCEMCHSMGCCPDAVACHCHSCGRRGVETCYPDTTLCVDCDAFRERSAAWFAAQRNDAPAAAMEAAE